MSGPTKTDAEAIVKAVDRLTMAIYATGGVLATAIVSARHFGLDEVGAFIISLKEQLEEVVG